MAKKKSIKYIYYTDTQWISIINKVELIKDLKLKQEIKDLLENGGSNA